MNQYLMAVHYVEGQEPPAAEDQQKAFDDVAKFNDKLQANGQWVFGGGLETPDTSTVVKNYEGDLVITDGPFPEAKEQIGGFWVVLAEDLDAALKLAAEASAACRGPVDVRPFQPEG